MPLTIADIMNKKVLYIADGDRISLARSKIVEFGVTAVPVLDDMHRPCGVVSLRDLARPDADTFVPNGPVATLKETDLVIDGARALAAGGEHHRVVVNAQGTAVGMVSAVDLLRALVGLPASHPEIFDRY